jgi:hypothetical protein
MRYLFEIIPRIYQREIVDAGKQPQFAVLVAFLVTFLVIRTITYGIKEGWPVPFFRDILIRGQRIHHLVPGILLLLISGYLAAALDRNQREIVAILFGVGAALTLDEFALWLHLEDVYWADRGRKSIDAVIVAATILGIFVIGGGFFVEAARELRDALL